MLAVEPQATKALLGAAPEALSLSLPRIRDYFTFPCEGTLVSDLVASGRALTR